MTLLSLPQFIIIRSKPRQKLNRKILRFCAYRVDKCAAHSSVIYARSNEVIAMRHSTFNVSLVRQAQLCPPVHSMRTQLRYFAEDRRTVLNRSFRRHVLWLIYKIGLWLILFTVLQQVHHEKIRDNYSYNKWANGMYGILAGPDLAKRFHISSL